MLSRIVPVYNKEVSIIDAINHIEDIMKNSGILYELIVVNDGSEDNTAKALSDSRFKFRLITHEVNE